MAPVSLEAMPTRRAVADLVRDRPGITQRTLQEHLGVAWGTVAYHVEALVSQGVLEAVTSHRRRSLFPSGYPPDHRPRLAVLRQEPAEVVHRYLSCTGRRREFEIADELGLSRRAVRRALQKMRSVGLVHRRGQHTAWYDAAPVPSPGGGGPRVVGSADLRVDHDDHRVDHRVDHTADRAGVDRWGGTGTHPVPA